MTKVKPVYASPEMSVVLEQDAEIICTSATDGVTADQFDNNEW